MKKSIKRIALLGLIAATSYAFTGGGRIKIYLQNKCSSDVSIKIESPGSSTTYTVYDGTSKGDTFLDGTKIYDSKGKLVHTVSSGSEGKTVVVCE